MLERGVGRSVTATRQNAGSRAKAVPPPRPPVDGAKAPAPTTAAAVTAASGVLMEARLSHVAADAGDVVANAHDTIAAKISVGLIASSGRILYLRTTPRHNGTTRRIGSVRLRPDRSGLRG